MAYERVHGARAALKLLEQPTRFLSTAQAGISLIGVFAGAYSGATLAEPLSTVLTFLGDYASLGAFAIVVIAITFLSLLFGELVPKRIAFDNPERIAAAVAPIMSWLSLIGAPVVLLLRVSTEAVLGLLRIPEKPQSQVSEEEVK